MKNKCDATIVFGDNDCTFHCELEEGHFLDHKETGTINEKKYMLVWENK